MSTWQVAQTFPTEWAVNRAVTSPSTYASQAAAKTTTQGNRRSIVFGPVTKSAPWSLGLLAPWSSPRACFADGLSGHTRGACKWTQSWHRPQEPILCVPEVELVGPWSAPSVPVPVAEAVNSQHLSATSFAPAASTTLRNTLSFCDADALAGNSGPASRVVALVGDTCNTTLLDHNTGRFIASLPGHLDFSFAVAFSPDGLFLATGNQDRSCQIYDLRRLDRPMFVLPTSRTAAVRVVEFSSDGRWLAVAEEADFVRVRNTDDAVRMKNLPCSLFTVASPFSTCPDLRLFSRLSGCPRNRFFWRCVWRDILS